MGNLTEAMEKISNAFSGFLLTDAVDILVMSLVFYFLFKLMSDNNSDKMVGWIFIILVFGLLAVIFDLPVSSEIIKMSMLILVILIFIVYSSEIKRLIWRNNKRFSYDILSDKYDCTDEELVSSMGEIIKAVQNMAKKDIGALIVMVQGEPPTGIIESGTVLNSLISAQLLESLFYPKTPLHDGAVLIKGNLVLAAGCFLPLSQELNLPKEIGTRHRAGIGISESNNVLAIVVSEETGIISLCESGKITRYVDSNMLKDNLERVYGLSLQKHTLKWSLRRK